MDFACSLTAGSVWAYQRNERNDAGVGKEPCDFADTTDVLGAVSRRKAEIGVDAVAKVVTIEHVGRLLLFDEQALDLNGNGRFARARQTGEPNGCTVESEVGPPFGAVEVAGMPNDICCASFLVAHQD